MTFFITDLADMRNLFLPVFIIVLNSYIYPAGINQPLPKESERGFMENKGQIINQEGRLRPDVHYLYDNNGFKLQLKNNSFSYELYYIKHDSSQLSDNNLASNLKNNIRVNSATFYHRVDIELKGSNPEPEIISEEKSHDYDNYYLAYTGEKGITCVYHYNKITYKNIYPNIDMVFYINNKDNEKQNVKYDFIVHPGGNISDIELVYNGTDDIYINPEKELILKTSRGDVKESIPVCYLQGNKTVVPAEFKLNKNVIRFNVADFDKSQTIVIDPNLLWGTYYGGGSNDCGYGLGSDGNGYVYLGGITTSTNAIATSGVHQTSYAGAGYTWDYCDIYIAKINSSGIREWGTYYGGSDYDFCSGLAADNSGNSFVSGYTESTSGISTAGAHQTAISGTFDALIAKFNTNGLREWGSYYGGTTDSDYGQDVAVDKDGNAFLVGYTFSTTKIATPGAYQTSLSGGMSGGLEAYLVKFNTSGVRQWGTYYGGNLSEYGWSVCTDIFDYVYITGNTNSTNKIATAGTYQTSFGGGQSDAYIAKFNNDGNFIWGTYYGGPATDNSEGIAADFNQNVYMAGCTNSQSNIATAGAHQTSYGGGIYDIFIAKFNSSGGIEWGTYYGGSGDSDIGEDIDVDNCGNSYTCGYTESPDNISTTGSHKQNLTGPDDGFLVKINTNGIRLYGTYYGGPAYDELYNVDVSKDYDIYIAGNTWSSSGIATAGTHQPTHGGGTLDAFLAKFDSGNIPFQVTATPETSLICGGDTIILTASGAKNDDYLWWPTTGLSSSTDSVVNAFPTTSTTYLVRGIDINGCTETDEVTVNIIPKTQEIDLGNDTAICMGESFTLDAGSLYANYLWHDGVTNSTHTASAAGIYWVYGSNECTYDFSVDSVVVQNLPLPAVNLPGDILICESTDTVLSAGTGFISYLWNDGSTDSSLSVSKGICWVQVTDSNGCENKVTILISMCQSLSYPNVFTPNSDGVNDYFYGTGKNIETFEIRIYNRWGKKVFTSLNKNTKWDGRSNGIECPEGVYYWSATYKDFQNKTQTLQGVVTLLR